MSTASKSPGWLAARASAPHKGDVLIVDDDARVRAALVRLVEREGHRVASAGSAEEADHHLSVRRFDVLLLDIQLPRMSGVEYLEWVLHRDPQIAVIMMTGVDDSDIARECLERGARTYFVKPPDDVFLSLAIRDALVMQSLLRKAT